jgi:hypothetical protein
MHRSSLLGWSCGLPVIPALGGLQRTSRTISSGFVHGFITLALAEHFVEFDDPVAKVLVPMG